MPNWCSNHITVRGSNQTEIQRLVEAFGTDGLCNAVIPTPKELTETVAGHCGNGYEQELNQFKIELNIKYFGFKDWYDFQSNRWGTKWDVNCDNVEIDEDSLGFSGLFESAWGPPIGVCEALVEQGFEVTLYYHEPGMAFVGKWEDGVDDCYEYGGEKAATVRAAIGDELDDMFGISESMWESEAEDEEELTEWIKDGIEKNPQLVAL